MGGALPRIPSRPLHPLLRSYFSHMLNDLQVKSGLRRKALSRAAWSGSSEIGPCCTRVSSVESARLVASLPFLLGLSVVAGGADSGPRGSLGAAELIARPVTTEARRTSHSAPRLPLRS